MCRFTATTVTVLAKSVVGFRDSTSDRPKCRASRLVFPRNSGISSSTDRPSSHASSSERVSCASFTAALKVMVRSHAEESLVSVLVLVVERV